MSFNSEHPIMHNQNQNQNQILLLGMCKPTRNLTLVLLSQKHKGKLCDDLAPSFGKALNLFSRKGVWSVQTRDVKTCPYQANREHRKEIANKLEWGKLTDSGHGLVGVFLMSFCIHLRPFLFPILSLLSSSSELFCRKIHFLTVGRFVLGVAG